VELKRQKVLGVVVHICNPSTQEAEAGGLQIQEQPGLPSEAFSPKKRRKDKKLQSEFNIPWQLLERVVHGSSEPWTPLLSLSPIMCGFGAL
jgi:hypothetical protein